MHIELSEKKIIAHDTNLYSSFPDIILLPNEELLCLYRLGNAHHPDYSSIVFLRSKDNGNQWSKHVFAESSIGTHGYVYNCPRFNIVRGEILLITDTKSSTKEGEAKWNMIGWTSSDSQSWSPCFDLKITGMVPDKIIKLSNNLYGMGYHCIDFVNTPDIGPKKQFIQMMALSRDNGLSWRDRITISTDSINCFCEGSFVTVGKKHIYGYMRNNKNPVCRGYFTHSSDSGLTWSKPSPVNSHIHRPVVRRVINGPYAGHLVGTYRNPSKKSIEMFVQESGRPSRITPFTIDTQKELCGLYDFGYTGFVELIDGTFAVVYYISGDNGTQIQFCRVKLS